MPKSCNYIIYTKCEGKEGNGGKTTRHLTQNKTKTTFDVERAWTFKFKAMDWERKLSGPADRLTAKRSERGVESVS